LPVIGRLRRGYALELELVGDQSAKDVDLADDLPIITGDRIQLQQVILNLLRNASDAMVDVAVSVFPDEICQTPRSWAEQAYPNLIHYNKVDRAGTSPPGSSRSCTPPSCARDSARFARCQPR
jgi:hypothetical protein